jgi:hypothetical protein
VLSAEEAVPDYSAQIGVVTPDDLERVVQTYVTPERRYLGLHDPVITVTSGAWIGGGVVGLGAGAWLIQRFWRRARARQIK